MIRRLLPVWFSVVVAAPPCLAAATADVPVAPVVPDYREFDGPPHRYFERTPTDRFTRVKEALESRRVQLDRSGEKAFLVSLLAFLEIPVSSQMLVFSTTSLQLGRIHPGNPRALYFSDELYLGYIPGGRIELVALDPDLGAVFYIFDIPRGGETVRAERSNRCMNCHAGDDTGHVPGLVVKSVLPGPSGGSLDSYRRGLSGHGIPFEERFGGWYVTGQGPVTNHWGNTIGRFAGGALTRIPTLLDERIGQDRYPLSTSDLLPQLIHEHQVGFVNRVVEAAYRARTHLHTDGPTLTAAHARELDEQAELVTRYMLFADEVPLPSGGITGEAGFRDDFQRAGRAVGGMTLRDLDLRTRLFRNRCSFMIHTPVFAGLPAPMKERIYRRLDEALSMDRPDPVHAHLALDEKRAIRRILRGTLVDLPAGW